MWFYSTSTNSGRGIRIFKYATDRAGDNAKDFLKGFNVYLHTDYSDKINIPTFNADIIEKPAYHCLVA